MVRPGLGFVLTALAAAGCVRAGFDPRSGPGEGGVNADLSVQVERGAGDLAQPRELAVDRVAGERPLVDLVASDQPAGGPSHQLSKNYGGPSTDDALAVAFDASGNLYLAGSLMGTVDLGSGPLGPVGASSDAFVASIAPSGAYRWGKRIAGASIDAASALAVDPSGVVYVTGSFRETVDLGAGAVTSQGYDDAFLISYTAAGTYRWGKRLGGTAADQGTSVSVDGAGNVILTATFGAEVDFGGKALSSSGNTDVALVSYTGGGVLRWANAFGGPASDWAVAAATASGQVRLAGWIGDSASYGGATLTSVGSWDVVVAGYDASGGHLFSMRAGGTGSDRAQGICVDAAGTLFVTGAFEGSASFGGATLVSAGVSDIFVASYDAAGVHRFSQRFGTNLYDRGHAAAVDGAGALYLTGYHSNGTDFGGGPLAASSDDIHVVKLSSNGVHLWSRSYGGLFSDAGHAIAVSSTGAIAVVGQMMATVDFGGGALSAAGSDAFLLLLKP
jgi:hypothetical protein